MASSEPRGRPSRASVSSAWTPHGVDDGFGLHIEDRAVFHIARMDANDFACALNQADGFNIVDGGAAEILEGAQQRDGVARIVKLAVVIENAAAKVSLCDAGQFFERRLAREQFRTAEGQLAREPFVDLEAHAVVRKRKIAVCGNDEREIVNEVRGVAQHVAALAQSIENQREVHLLEIAHAAMDKLGAAAGGFLGEIGALDEQRAIAPRSGFDGGAEAGGSAANHKHIPWLASSAQFTQNFLSCAHARHFPSE